MAEPRARVLQQKGHPNFAKELRLLMYAYGDDREPLDETVKVFDEIVTDFIIETCHEASRSAQHARRQKIKVDDFRFALRKDAVKLGRVQELLQMDKVLKDWRKAFNENDDRIATDLVGGDGEDVSAATASASAAQAPGGRTAAPRAAPRSSSAAAAGEGVAVDEDGSIAATGARKRRRKSRKENR
ncbi:MAG: Transcription initiation factor TFIID subunit 13 [Lichina confinis]|nr:MAG: Transcription initiation factor TFIID subunit 13 [Lichina confinis]